MAKHKHKPQRTCIACRKIKDKRDLIRVVRTPEGKVVLDLTGKANGRGAYLCRDPHCCDKGLKIERLAQILKATLSSEEMDELYASVQIELSKV